MVNAFFRGDNIAPPTPQFTMKATIIRDEVDAEPGRLSLTLSSGLVLVEVFISESYTCAGDASASLHCNLAVLLF